MDEALTPVIVALVGLFQVALAIYFGRRTNEAAAERDQADAKLNLGASYSTLVERLETRLDKLETLYNKLCDEYEQDKALWLAETEELLNRIAGLEQDKDIWQEERKELLKRIAELERKQNGD
jgi:hypothetical protein